MKKIIFTICLIFITVGLFAKGEFKVNTNIKTAYEQIISLKITAAQATLNKERKVAPNNLMVDYLENYIDCIKVFISEDEALFNKLEPKKYKRLAKIEAGNKNSQYYLHTQAMIRIQWLMARSKFGESMTSIRELKKASALFTSNKKKYPTFIGNDHGLGCIHVMVGAIPDDYAWGKSLLGLSGNLKQGFRELNKTLTYSKTKYYLFEKEAIMMTAYLQLQFGKDKNDAWKTISSPRISISKSPIAAYTKAAIGLYTGRATASISVLASAKPKTGQYAIPQWDYLYGTAKLYRLDKNADFYLNRFVTNFKGRHQIKQAYEKLAQHALIYKSVASYKAYIAKGKRRGRSDTDGDKQAQTAMTSTKIPNKTLLKADFLHSGGYYTKSLEILGKVSASSFTGQNKAQYYYIKGRNYQDKRSYTQSISTYKKLISMPESKGSYFACSAAFQIGVMYEKQKKNSSAKVYFQKCLNMKSDKYEASLHARAQAGLARVR